MKLRYLLLFACTFANAVFAQNPVFFEQYINSGISVQFNYSFFSGSVLHPQIICYSSTVQDPNSIITWPYKKVAKGGNLPILLTNNSIYSGEFADDSGVIRLTNTTNQRLLYTCGYTF